MTKQLKDEISDIKKRHRNWNKEKRITNFEKSFLKKLDAKISKVKNEEPLKDSNKPKQGSSKEGELKVKRTASVIFSKADLWNLEIEN